jgi:hypothetical protein
MIIGSEDGLGFKKKNRKDVVSGKLKKQSKLGKNDVFHDVIGRISHRPD